MSAVDSNILIYAHRTEAELHGTAASRLVSLAEGMERWALHTFGIGAFMQVVTHGHVFNPPSTVEQSAEFVENIVTAPSCEVVSRVRSFSDIVSRRFTKRLQAAI